MKEKIRAIKLILMFSFIMFMLVIAICSVVHRFSKPKYEEIHSKHIEEDGSTLLIERK